MWIQYISIQIIQLDVRVYLCICYLAIMELM